MSGVKVTVTKGTENKVESYRGKASIIVWESDYYREKVTQENKYRFFWSHGKGFFILF